ncbi:MAG TPA: hypothetical protein VNZ03_04675 [Terriglobales bacterium]|nr:hypothetical protein [Terriglobales bacterium]
MLYFAGWKQHYSLYPAGKYVVATLKNQLAPYKVNKGTIRFARLRDGSGSLRLSQYLCDKGVAIANFISAKPFLPTRLGSPPLPGLQLRPPSPLCRHDLSSG